MGANAAEAAVRAVWKSLRHPLSSIQQVADLSAGRSTVDGSWALIGDLSALRTLWPAWTMFGAIAVGATVIYGGSVGAVLARPIGGQRSSEDTARARGTEAERQALRLLFATACAWCSFGPGLIWLTHRNMLTCAQACLVTMTYGESVLLAGAATNAWALRRAQGRGDKSAVRRNVVFVAISNVVMAWVLTAQLRAVGVPAHKSLLAWNAILNGGGAVFYWLFGRVLASDEDSQ